jgi:hypothetical protein
LFKSGRCSRVWANPGRALISSNVHYQFGNLLLRENTEINLLVYADWSIWNNTTHTPLLLTMKMYKKMNGKSHNIEWKSDHQCNRRKRFKCRYLGISQLFG